MAAAQPPVDPTDSSTERSPAVTPRRRRTVTTLWAAGAAAAVLLGLTVSGTISGFGATINNSTNTISTGTLTLQETGPDSTGTSTTCTSTVSGGTCATINKYGDGGKTVTTLAPGQSYTTTVTLKNTGSTSASQFSLTPNPCQSSGSGTGNLCDQLQVTVTSSTTGVTLTPAIAAKTPNQMNTQGQSVISGGLASGASDTFVFTVSLPSTADNTYQGLTATQALVWNIQT